MAMVSKSEMTFMYGCYSVQLSFILLAQWQKKEHKIVNQLWYCNCLSTVSL